MERWPEVKCWLVDYCRYGTPWRKRTRFYLNVAEAEQKTLCSGGHTHQLLRGRSKVHKTNWTRVAQAYPAGVCKVLAGLLVARMYTCEDEKLDIVGCAKCSNSRIGDACNPGPRCGTGPRFGVLEEVPWSMQKLWRFSPRSGLSLWLGCNVKQHQGPRAQPWHAMRC